VLTVKAHVGTNKVLRRLRSGRYSVTVTATNAAGQRSTPKALKFKLAAKS
jgi:predicted phage tail protein